MPKLPRPAGHHTITPGIHVPDRKADRVLQFIEKAFGGRVTERYPAPDGSVAHAEVMIGDCIVMLGDVSGDAPPMPAALAFYVDDGPAVDQTYARALAAGATSVQEPKNQFYGYRSAAVRDTAGNRWTICAVVEQLSKAEIERRAAEMMKG